MIVRTAAMLAAATALAAPALAADTILAGNLIADAGEGGTGPATIVIDEGRILSVTPGHEAPRHGTVYDWSDKTVMPGLIDLHVHLTGNPSGNFWEGATTPTEWNVILGVVNAETTLEAGFTTVRDVGSRGNQSVHMLRRATAEGVVPGPRIVSAGNSIAIIGGHGDVNGFREEVNEALDSGYTCTGPVECAAKVRLASQNGAEVIKITATGGVLSQQGRGLEAHFTSAEMEAIAETAHSLGLKVAAHAHGARGVEVAARAGIDTIDHGTFADRAALSAMAEHGTYLVPTLLAFRGVSEMMAEGAYTEVVNMKIREVMPEVGKPIALALELGVPIAFGTDAGVFAHGRNAEEFEMLVQYGMTPRQALESATTIAARALGMEREVGRIAAGMSADLIAFEGDPYADVTVLQDIDAVMVRGRLHAGNAAR
ncbi:metal-dependent hydrolase family protein [Sphingomicrobium astaxanthinifaciens]|uniref:metal-dependent hydrolase family protein n=1 Tax=Sphingomicrobium astaxanthinifaciens TaxID=1227949 RepID=UPI001FCB523D|nr:amidohydrolase family protein [Sphingomicrobium astaxanthinifaciens]MCJ7420552.1 amidohydrolase family protein [Sphingomicrobium astaxanthinifaciens]